MNTAINYHILTCATSNISIKKKSTSPSTSHITRMHSMAQENERIFIRYAVNSCFYTLSSLYFLCGSSRFLKLCCGWIFFLRVNENVRMNQNSEFCAKRSGFGEMNFIYRRAVLFFVAVDGPNWMETNTVESWILCTIQFIWNAKIDGSISVRCFYDGAKSLNE